jgi:hypothetical protein
MKAMGTTAGAGLVSTSVLGNTRVEPVALDPRKAEPSAPRIETATDLKRVSANYMLLVVDESSVRFYIDNSDATRDEKRQAHENLGDLKRAFPLRKRKDGNLTRYELAEGARSHPDEEETEKFQQLSKVFNDGTTGFVDTGGPSTQHHPSLHRTMTESAGNEMGLSSEVVYTTSEAADDPDDPNVSIDIPDVVPHDEYIEDGIEDFLADVIHHVGQYYNPDPFWSYSYLCDHNSTYHEEDDEVDGIGGAPYATEYHFDKADNNSGENEETWAGRLTHFPQDMGQPLHTGMAWEQANLDIKYDWSGFYVTVDPKYWLHYGYEDFVRDYWDNSYHEFHKAFDDGDDCDGSCYYYYETYGDGHRLVDYIADFSHQYSETVYKTIMEEDGERDPSNWDFSTRDDLSQLTRDCLVQTGKWTRGCLHRYFVD